MPEQDNYPTAPTKKPWQSKTLWINAIMAIGAFIPIVQPFLNPEAISTIFLVVNTILRLTTKSGISIS